MEKLVDNFTIAPAVKDEVLYFYKVPTWLKWDPVVDSHLIMEQASPEGLLLGKINGKVVCCIAALKYSKKWGFVAVYWTREEYRGQGLGTKILHKAI